MTTPQKDDRKQDRYSSHHAFKSANSLVKRTADAERMRGKYPDRIPVILEAKPNSQVPAVDRNKYLVPHDLTLGQFAYVIRRRIKLSPDQAIFFFIKNVLPVCSLTMAQLDDEYRDEDGFLYVTYSGENTFGGGLRPPQTPLFEEGFV